MSERFSAWMAVRAQEDAFRISMAMAGLFIATIWFSFQYWPDRLRAIGRKLFLIVGSVAYAAFFVVGLLALVDALTGSR